MSKEIKEKADAVVELHYDCKIGATFRSDDIRHAIAHVKGEFKLLWELPEWGAYSDEFRYKLNERIDEKKAILKELEGRL